MTLHPQAQSRSRARFLADRIRTFIQSEAVLAIAALAAVASMAAFPPVPDNLPAHLEAIDLRTIGLLFCLMTVVAGFTRAGLLARARTLLTRGQSGARRIVLLLVTISFFASMVVTNDVALISFVPLTLLLLQHATPRTLIIALVAQTVAANLGSMMTPIGNPQNIYLYSTFNIDLGTFLATLAPYGILGLAASLLPCVLIPNEPLAANELRETPINRHLLAVYSVLFALALACVGRIVSWELCTIVTIAACLVFDRSVLRHIDYSLLATFVCFFIFVGNLKHVDALVTALQGLLAGREVLVSALTSQVISNVPAAIMLSGFTHNATGLLIGTNIGGLGTPVASLASLITLRIYARSGNAQTGRYLLYFLVYNVILLALFLALACVLGHV